MLVLTRKSEQKIVIGENITITILKVRGQSVRVGIEAPDGVRILRSELPRYEDDPVPAVSDNDDLPCADRVPAPKPAHRSGRVEQFHSRRMQTPARMPDSSDEKPLGGRVPQSRLHSRFGWK